VRGNRTGEIGNKKKERSKERKKLRVKKVEREGRKSKINMKKTGNTGNEEMTINGGNKKDKRNKY